MAIVTIPEENRKIEDADEIRALLASVGIDYERAEPDQPVAPDAPPEELLAAYKAKIDDLSARGGYVTADVLNVFPSTPGLDAMLNRFNSEHWHSEDEVRFIIEGRGVFHIHPPGQHVLAVEVGPGDLIRVPRAVCRDFTNISDQTAYLLVLITGTSEADYNDSGFAPEESERFKARFGEAVSQKLESIGFSFME